ncbi:hypothetical protein HPB49_001732 [Dermacentor silvarum]|uniref:Uncharacterized protein n=1 Tax=Dermacentor silvarum TaxID=543639 RepID=A0ACB8CJ90_DERSI|nr:hypothetical protein HPB49_001732 [Dermacentor silvarum]
MSPEGPQEPGAATVTTSTVMTSPLDHILIFGHGRFQWLVLLCTTLAYYTAISHGMATAGLARPIDHWCSPPPEYSNIPEATWKNTSIPFEADGKTHSQCLQYDPPFSVPDEQGAENRTVIPCNVGWDYGKAANTDVGVYSIVNQWDLVCERHWLMVLLMASYMSGGVLGAATAGIAADTVGRLPVLRIWLFLLALGGLALTLSKTLLLFATLRAVLSAAASSVLAASVVILFEVTDTPAPSPFQHPCPSIYCELVYQLAPSWQLAQMAYMVPTSVLIAVVYLMDESPCWLLAVSNTRRAESVLCWAARVNKIEPEVFKKRLTGLRMELKRPQEQPEPGALDTLSQERGVHFTDMVRNETLRYRSAILFGCSFLSFALYYNLGTGEVMRTNLTARMVLIVLKLPGVLVEVPVITHAGRRRSLALSMVVMSVLALALSGAHAFSAPDGLLAALTVSWLLAFDLCAITIFVFSAELYPTVMRGAGVGLCYAFGRMGAFVAPFVNEIRSAKMKGVAYAVAAALLLLFGVMAMMLPETTRLLPSNTMQEMAANKWRLRSPLRIARTGKRKRPKNENRDPSRTR